MKFIALGGTDYVGASCYFVELDGTKLLLDCGKGICKSRGQVFSPTFTDLLTTGNMSSLGQLDAILISHAHFDHIGAISEVTSVAPDTPVFATSLTKELAEYLLFDRLSYWEANDNLSDFKQKFAVSESIDRIQPIGYSRSFSVGTVTVTFLEAGHVPGAAAIYLQSNEKNVLYTGDYRLDATPLTTGLQLPEWVKPDTVILNGIHANHPSYHPKDTLYALISKIKMHTALRMPVQVQIPQLTKGIEVLALLEQSDITAPVYLDSSIYQLAERMSYLGVPIFTDHTYRLPPLGSADGICLSGKIIYGMPRVKADFTLHSTYQDDLTLLMRLQPKQVYLVHAPKSRVQEHDSLQNQFPEMNIICPEQGKIYN